MGIFRIEARGLLAVLPFVSSYGFDGVLEG